jgi:hypothetical protein
VIREEALVQKLTGQFTESTIKEALAWLEQENLLLNIGAEYLALPIDRDAGKQT